jgi:hypothetical protein
MLRPLGWLVVDPDATPGGAYLAELAAPRLAHDHEPVFTGFWYVQGAPDPLV